MVSYADADEVGLDVVSGEGEGGKQPVGDVIAEGHLLVEQHAELFRGERRVVAQPHVEHEAEAVEHHLVGYQQAGLEVEIPVGLGDLVGVVVDELDAHAQTVALAELEHEVDRQVVDEEILVCAILLAHVLDAKRVLVVGDEMLLAVELEEIMLGSQPLVDVRLRRHQIPRKARGHTEDVDAHVGTPRGSVREVGQAGRKHPMQALDDALTVFKRQVDGSVEVRAYGVVVVVFFWVELVGKPRQAHAQLKRQLTRLARRDGEVDERVEGKHTAQLGCDAVVVEVRVIEGEADRRVVVQHLPTVLAVGVAMNRQLVRGRVSAVTS